MRILITLLTLSLNLHSDEVRDFWFAGAEINRYVLTQIRYGEAHPGHAEFIFVTEPFLTDKQVKNETGDSPSADVLKLNALRTFNTGIYSYRTMTSTFQPIDLEQYPHALKTNTSVQDWCGQAFQQLNKTPNGWRGELRSYFQNFADQNFELEDVPLEDELWLQLRLAPTALPTGNFQIVPGAVFTRFAHQPIAPATATGTLVYGKTQSIYTLTYKDLKRSLRIHFDTEFPHIIRSWEEKGRSGTTKAVLTHRIMHSEYWSENAPQDAAQREKLGLDPKAN